MGTYPPQVRPDLGVGPRGNSGSALAPCHMSPSQSAITQWGWGLHTLRGGIDPRDLHLRSRVVGVVERRVSDPGMGSYPPQVRWDLGVGPRGNSRRAMAPRAPAHQQSLLELGFPHLAGRYRPGVSAFSSPGCFCRDIEGFLTRGWELILPGCGRTSALARGATLAARWLHAI